MQAAGVQLLVISSQDLPNNKKANKTNKGQKCSFQDLKFKLIVRDHGTDINVSESNIQTAVLFLKGPPQNDDSLTFDISLTLNPTIINQLIAIQFQT